MPRPECAEVVADRQKLVDELLRTCITRIASGLDAQDPGGVVGDRFPVVEEAAGAVVEKDVALAGRRVPG
jgi:hypothetical protein